MSKTVQVTGTLIPVEQKIEAEPGQKLLIVAGVCVGVYTGEALEQALPRSRIQLPTDAEILAAVHDCTGSRGHAVLVDIIVALGIQEAQRDAFHNRLRSLVAAGRLLTQPVDPQVPKKGFRWSLPPAK